MASVLQSVFDIGTFQERYYQQLADHPQNCQNEPANCWHCQLHKMADGMLSGRYSQPKEASSEDQAPSQDGIAPTMFKALVGKGHEEFSTMRQQDAFEFFQYLCKTISQKEHAAKANDPTKVFDFAVEQRLQCGKCKKVRYQVDTTNSISVNVPARKVESEDGDKYQSVDFYECLDLFVQEEAIEGYHCPSCNESTVAYK